MKLTHRLLTALLLVPLAALHATDLALSTNGCTGFRIVKPANPSVVDDYALAKLSGYLKQITGVEFPMVSADEAADDSPCLYVGVNAAVNEKLGGIRWRRYRTKSMFLKARAAIFFFMAKAFMAI